MSSEETSVANDAAPQDDHDRGPHSRTELVDLDTEPVTLNLGSGTDPRGIGIDLNYENADITADLNDGIPVEDDTVDRVIAEHVLEHVENPSFLLREIRRALRPGGKALIEVPNVGWLPVRLYLTQDLHRFWEHKIPGQAGHWLARHVGNPDPDRTAHLTLWTPRLLANHLDRVGFDYEFQSRTHLVRNIRVIALPTDHESDSR